MLVVQCVPLRGRYESALAGSWPTADAAPLAPANINTHGTVVKVKVHTHDIAPPRSESPPQ